MLKAGPQDGVIQAGACEAEEDDGNKGEGAQPGLSLGSHRVLYSERALQAQACSAALAAGLVAALELPPLLS
ncbi:unnamed protein product [Boreogadus saida]